MVRSDILHSTEAHMLQHSMALWLLSMNIFIVLRHTFYIFFTFFGSFQILAIGNVYKTSVLPLLFILLRLHKYLPPPSLSLSFFSQCKFLPYCPPFLLFSSFSHFFFLFSLTPSISKSSTKKERRAFPLRPSTEAKKAYLLDSKRKQTNWKNFREFRLDVLNDHSKRTTANKLKLKGWDACWSRQTITNIWTRSTSTEKQLKCIFGGGRRANIFNEYCSLFFYSPFFLVYSSRIIKYMRIKGKRLMIVR